MPELDFAGKSIDVSRLSQREREDIVRLERMQRDRRSMEEQKRSYEHGKKVEDMERALSTGDRYERREFNENLERQAREASKGTRKYW